MNNIENIQPEEALVTNAKTYDTFATSPISPFISTTTLIDNSFTNKSAEKILENNIINDYHSSTLAANLNGLSIVNTISSEDETLSSSSDEDFEKIDKEPYEDKYIKLSTISALDFVATSDPSDISLTSSDAVLSVVQRVANMAFFLCLVSSFLAAIYAFFLSAYSILPWHLIYSITACLWGYCLYAQGNSLSLSNSITGARRISMGITVIQGVAYLLESVIHDKSNNGPGPLSQTEAFSTNPFLYGGSMLGLPCYIVLEQILIAYQRENFRKQALLQYERENSQTSLYRAIDRFSERKGLYLRTISKRLRNNTELAMTTLKQLSPPNFLSKPHEQLSACSIPIPTASINAIHTTLKAINYMSSHLGTLSLLLFTDNGKIELSHVKRNFDIGEMLQNIGDALAGFASNANVELVLYHVFYGLNHINVVGDEATLRYALFDLLKSILKGASDGACIEVGLKVRNSEDADGTNDDDLLDKDTVINPRDKVMCTIEITHNFASSSLVSEQKRKSFLINPTMQFSARVFKFIGANLSAEQKEDKQLFNVSLELEVGPPLEKPKAPRVDEETRKRFPHLRISGEPSIEDLKKFSKRLRGLRIGLHATTNSHFAKHVTNCLTTWSTDISHVPIGGEDGIEIQKTDSRPGSNSASLNSSSSRQLPSGDSGSYEDNMSEQANLPPAFIIIDDDVDTLKEQLIKLRNAPFQVGIASMLNARGRHKRGQTPNLLQQTTAVIHFTSLTNYKLVKDTVQLILSPANGSFPLLQVLVIPKPAGPRRFLTALHTASNKIVVDPVYMPIATSPMSPGQKYKSGCDDSESNPLDREMFGDSTRNPYFNSESAGNCHTRSNPSTPSKCVNNTRSDSNTGTPVSPRSGPGGGLLIIPKTMLSPNNRTVNTSPNGKVIQNQMSPQIIPVSSSPHRIDSAYEVNNVSTSPPPINSPPLQNIQQSPGRRITTGSSTTKSQAKTNKAIKLSVNSEDIIPPINVLIVEDNPINQAILSGFMRKKKIKYECVNNGQEAVDKWKDGHFHLVLMDIQLPVMDGIEATKEIRRCEKLQKIGVLPSTPPAASSQSSSATSSVASTPLVTPIDIDNPLTLNTPPPAIRSPVIIVALTASSLPSDRKNALTAGCNDFLTKPVSLVWLEKKIKEWGCMQILIDFEVPPKLPHQMELMLAIVTIILKNNRQQYEKKGNTVSRPLGMLSRR
ncbi:4352_t:CDS:2 [Ambispora gerdemannii]|uniref:4352_t:CDS:1 n=1 Tax=Ambispora gerdemannii TaxID=144530 RepID=A0A9N9BYX8_9GLOM|nr:4352_t:CDS:2 [Ambispora gerdemannii]